MCVCVCSMLFPTSENIFKHTLSPTQILKKRIPFLRDHPSPSVSLIGEIRPGNASAQLQHKAPTTGAALCHVPIGHRLHARHILMKHSHKFACEWPAPFIIQRLLSLFFSSFHGIKLGIKWEAISGVCRFISVIDSLKGFCSSIPSILLAIDSSLFVVGV